ncbi:hypothetical protein EMCG_01317 [[Emmonsia] crescens]|uniref:Uncharacterized protein n=1 Tax=[Emmonsia] crescens TaxID=73230 RepID=A0A0G2I358_9EURO|nr:hypothetical protein EMCG_01317 [Emmonsia crescens UAMH 3008]
MPTKAQFMEAESTEVEPTIPKSTYTQSTGMEQKFPECPKCNPATIPEEERWRFGNKPGEPTID